MQPRSLFESAPLGPLTLPNRIVMAPMTRTRATEAGVPTELMRDYYVQRASAGLIVTECTQVSEQGHGIIRAPGLHTDEQVKGWHVVVDGVHAASGRIFCQLWHCGRASHQGIRNGEPPVAPSAIAAGGDFFLPTGRVPFPTPRALETDEIPGIVSDFATAARNAKAAGFDGVELHGAFGYLPDQFLQDGSNKRTDRYGGSIENRARFMLETIDALVEIWGADSVGIKLSPSNRFYGMFDSDARATFGHVIGELVARGIAYVHLMEPSAADLATGTVQIAQVAKAFRPQIRATLIANGGFDKASAEAALAAGAADLVSFGVLFIANPDLPERLRRDAPFNAPDPTTFYGEGPRGYTTYPTLAHVAA
jgi:N-ethylmaleimide reductase